MVLEKEPSNSMAYYYKACARANTWDSEKAIKNLTKALSLGEWLIEFAKKDKHLEKIKGNKKFIALIKTDELKQS